MISVKKQSLSIIALVVFFCSSCTRPSTSELSLLPVSSQEVAIYPDYTHIVVPPNIAPLNFRIDSDGERFVVDFIGENGYSFSLSTSKEVIIPIKKWKKLLNENIGKSYQIQVYRRTGKQWEKFPAIVNTVSYDSIDPYLTYRLLHPGYETASYLTIEERHLETFDRTAIINNSLADGSCMNCHLTNWGDPNQFVIHFRFANSGTIVYRNGEYRRINTATPTFLNQPGIHPAWHPSGRFIAFSTNTAELYFHSDVFKRSESYDSKGNIAILDLETNTMLASPKLLTADPVQETFPCWSPDGKYLYFCRFDPGNTLFDTLAQGPGANLPYIKYDLLRISFDMETLSFGDIDTIVDSKRIDKTVALPRVSPDGRYLMLCIADRGTFTVWKREADLYLIDLQTREMKSLVDANSDESESYHSWSSNSRWFVVSSKRRNGFVALPYFSHIDSAGNASKAFLLPQKNPNFYESWIRSFNIPELAKDKSPTDIYEFEKAVKGSVIKAKFDYTNDKSKTFN